MILDFIKKQSQPTILAGDFNLGINTRALSMLEEKLTNLVKTYKLPTTRSNLYDPYYRINDPFADYVMVSREIKVNDFKALADEVSDHLALFLKFEI